MTSQYKSNRSWAEHFASFAINAAKKSKDTTKVGAVLVGEDGETILTAFNGPAAGVLDLPERFERPRKYNFAAHAEQNLIAFAARRGIRTKGCEVWCTHMPCAKCAITLIQAGIRSVSFGPGTTSMPEAEFADAKQMFQEAGVRLEYWPDDAVALFNKEYAA